MHFKTIVLALLTSSLTGAFGAAAAQAQEPGRPAGACFEIVVPSRSAPLAHPLLLNKCTGATWVLVKTDRGRLPYRWFALETDSPPVADGRGRRTTAAPDPNRPGQKCFELSGRRFCE